MAKHGSLCMTEAEITTQGMKSNRLNINEKMSKKLLVKVIVWERR